MQYYNGVRYLAKPRLTCNCEQTGLDVNDFLCHAGRMDEEQRNRVAEYVRSQRAHKFGTVDAARIEAGISRGAWDSVEQGKKVRDFTYGAVEKALDLPAGYLAALSKGNEELMEGLTEGNAIFRDLMEWAAQLVPGRMPEPPPTSALMFWSTEQILEDLSIREQGTRETIRWHIQRYENLKARMDALLAGGELPEAIDDDGEAREAGEERLADFYRELEPAPADENSDNRDETA